MDWVALFDAHSIEYVTRGPNTKRGEVSIQCPWCGDEDPSQHLGISLNKANWGCHRNGEHRGHSPVYLVAALLGCSTRHAKTLVQQYSRADPETLEEALAALTGEDQEAEEDEGDLTKEIKMPAEARLIYAGDPLANPAWRYLATRGYGRPGILADLYGLKYCPHGHYAQRIVIPVRHDKKLIGFTARAITPVRDAPRYLHSSKVVKATIFDRDEALLGGDVLFICEGPFDAMRIGYLHGVMQYEPPTPMGLENFRVRAVATFGTSLTPGQIGFLRHMTRKFKKAYLLFDDDATAQVYQWTDWIGAPVASLPLGAQDPGELNIEQYHQLLRHYA